MPIFLLLISQDTNTGEYPYVKLQRIAMEKLVCVPVRPNDFPTYGDYLSPNYRRPPFKSEESAHNICLWDGIQCFNSIIGRIRWDRNYVNSVSLRCINAQWLPPYVNSVAINKQDVEYVTEFSTRCLPRSLIAFQMQECKLWGRLDLTVLPHRLTRFIVARNEFGGTIDLRRLPLSLVRIDVRRNNLLEAIVDSDRLPDTLENVELGTKPGAKKTLVVRETSGRKKDSRIRVESVPK